MIALVLAIDIGNTHTVLGIFRGKKLVADWRISSASVRTEDEIWVAIKPFFDHVSLRLKDLSGVVISSVVPNLTDPFERTSTRYLNIAPVMVSLDLDLGITIRYENPRAVGADRLCNAVAAFEKYGGPCIVVDFGTATTYDVISKRGEYLGGVIAPGVETAAAELHRRAALLPKVDLHFPDHVIGTNTVESMQAGILYGAIDAMEGMIKRIRKVVGRQATVIATGGFSSLIARETKVIDYVEPSLVLKGAMLIYRRAKGLK